MATIAYLAIACLPITALVVGLICRSIIVRALQHIEMTQVVGGTPKDVFIRKNEQGLAERKQRLEARKPKSIKGVIS